MILVLQINSMSGQSGGKAQASLQASDLNQIYNTEGEGYFWLKVRQKNNKNYIMSFSEFDW